MTPMIDVVFLLLIFFLSTASFTTVEFLLPTNLQVEAESTPNGQTGSIDQWLADLREQRDEIVIKINTTDGLATYDLAGEAVAVGELQTRLRDIAQLPEILPIIIQPAPQVEMATAIMIYDFAVDAGCQEIYFAVKE